MEAVVVCSESVVGVVQGAVDLVLGEVGGVGPEGACVALCSMGEDCIEQSMFSEVSVEVLEAVLRSKDPDFHAEQKGTRYSRVALRKNV